MKLAEYIWIDGTSPSPQLRSKTKVIQNNTNPPIWGFDGSSTSQAPAGASDCVLRPVFTCADPFRGPDDILTMCEVLYTDMFPHVTNARQACAITADRHEEREGWFGLEQEYTLMWNERPLGFPEKGYPEKQGQYYCSVGAGNAHGRKIAEEHLQLCLAVGLNITGINAEVCPGQWEFQIGGPEVGAVSVSDQLWVARWILYRVAEKHGVTVSLDPKPVKGDWNGAGCHTNFSTKEMRQSYTAIEAAAKALEKNADLHIFNYGHDIASRLTGEHETCSHKEFKWGVSDRGASLRIPWQCAQQGYGYLEDRRPNANCDPYVVTRLILNTVCSK
jgi:glutamine synthetase|tara:strand:- start:1749 stop:2744 length:996 start_codon:yes stop_codon:yes gene_type:complete